MGSVFNRGTRDKPNWYGKWKELDGEWLTRPTGQPTKVQARKWVEEREGRVANGEPGVRSVESAPTCSELMERWEKTLTNRSAKDDRSRLRRHVLPRFGEYLLSAVTLAEVMHWIDEQRAPAERVGGGKKGRGRPVLGLRISDATIRHNLNLLSRFFSWATERGYTTTNPVRMIPTGRRPRQSAKADVPWLDDDAVVRQLVAGLGAPLGLMFYLGNRSGLRTGEAAGLRMSDLGFLAEGIIRVRFSYDGPLKEDKAGTGKSKWAPAPDDVDAVLGPWLSARTAAGAGPEDLVFPTKGGQCYQTPYIERRWNAVAKKCVLKLTWYQATRHSFVSRNLSRGASLDEVSSAVGHSSPVVTRRYYDHFVRRTFSDTLRAGLGITVGAEGQGKLVRLPTAPAKPPRSKPAAPGARGRSAR